MTISEKNITYSSIKNVFSLFQINPRIPHLTTELHFRTNGILSLNERILDASISTVPFFFEKVA